MGRTERPWEAEEPWTLARGAEENDVKCPWTHQLAGMGTEREEEGTLGGKLHTACLPPMHARVCMRPVEAALLSHTQPCPVRSHVTVSPESELLPHFADEETEAKRSRALPLPHLGYD